jgi:hypothetical protein
MRLAALVFAIATTGCMAGLPPARLDGGGGVVGPAHGPDDARAAGPVGSVRAALFPAQLWESALGRTFDFGAGYGYDGSSTLELHTGFAELDVMRPLVGSRASPIFGVGVAPRLVYDALRDNFGGGIGLRMSIDLSRRSFFNEYYYDQNVSGVVGAGAYGQASFGFYLEASLVSVGPYAFATGTAGMTFRLPAMGFLVF